MLTLQEISDRLEIQQLAVDYAHAIDSRCFDLLDRVFTPDAYIDYRVFGGIDGRYPEVKLWLRDVLSAAPAYQHLVGNFDLKIDADRGCGRIMCLNPVGVPVDEGKRGMRMAFYALWYMDTYIRTVDGWRISSRMEEKAFDPWYRG
ncbi:nuclear transport factor 2 family protein [Paraburkholderia phymatum]|uniref:nuclear transport factor 2 family protein n=1 Tax=Paraburkholderia phymatum TaxID=148447 RepID=UPI003170DE92